MMKKLLPFLVTACLLGLGVFTACSGDDDFSSSTRDVLTFPADTISLDTLIAGEGSRTYHFSVHNRNSKGLIIRHVALGQGSVSPFRVNIDGSFVGDGYEQDIRVRGKDSIQVWIEATPPKTGDATPQYVGDRLTLTLESGATQSIWLEAYGQDVVLLNNMTITSDTTFADARPYHVYGNLTVAEGATLTLSAGVRLLFHDRSGMVVEGTLLAEGAMGREVVFRGDRLDQMFVNQPYDRIPGRWEGIRFASSSYGNRLNYCDVHSGNYGIRCDSASTADEKLRLTNSVVHNVTGLCLELTACRTFVGNSQITNGGWGCVTLRGGRHQFVHCTVADFYPFEGKTGAALYMHNALNGFPLPLEQADFLNCIVTGSSDDEVYGSFLDDESVAANYMFRNCLLTTDSVADEHFYRTVWDRPERTVWGAKNFKSFDLDRLTFDFHLDSLSRGIGQADVEQTRLYFPTDRDGVERLSDGAADVGCYEFVPSDR